MGQPLHKVCVELLEEQAEPPAPSARGRLPKERSLCDIWRIFLHPDNSTRSKMKAGCGSSKGWPPSPDSSAASPAYHSCIPTLRVSWCPLGVVPKKLID
ncbi:hypothetical protein H8959_017464 [Pygathrix nigripes]